MRNKMNSLVFDIETDDLDATKIWCMSICDVDTEHVCSYWGDNLDKGLEELQSADKLIGHNIIGFDIPVIRKLVGVDLSNKKLIDTLAISRLLNPVRDGGHTLESWGGRLGLPKIEFDDYETFSIDMVKYCERDVLLNKKVYDALRREAKGFSSESIKLEQETARIIADQRKHGFLFDAKAASLLNAELNEKLSEVVTEVHKEFKPHTTYHTLRPAYNKDGSISKMGELRTEKNSKGDVKKSRLTDEEFATMKKEGTVVRTEVVPFNLGSRKQIGEYLQEFGWKPKKLTPTGQPIVDEGTLKGIKDIPQAKLIADYLLYQKRIAQIDSWFEKLEDDGRVHGFVISNGTITGRMTHRNPNMAQVPSVNSPYGKECRACWIVPNGYKLVGIDASGLELRMLAHYMNDKDYINEIIHGDIHSTNQKLAGLESRNQAKTFIYALIYGAGDGKLGTVVGGNKRDGAELKQRFLNNLPSLKTLRDRVSRAAAKGSIKSLDGRKLFVRSPHSALNTLLQGGGAVVMKRALVILNKAIQEKSYSGGYRIMVARFVANIHDEWQLEVDEDHADMVGCMGVDAIRQTADHYDLNCPLDGEYRIGRDWSETH